MADSTQLLEDILNDDACVKQLAAINSVDEIKAFFQSKNIEATDEFIEAMIAGRDNVLNGEELPEDLLELVSGGKNRFARALAGAAAGAAIGTCASPGAGTIFGGLVGAIVGGLS